MRSDRLDGTHLMLRIPRLPKWRTPHWNRAALDNPFTPLGCHLLYEQDAVGCQNHELWGHLGVETAHLRGEAQIVDPVAADHLDPILGSQNCLPNACVARHVGVSCFDAFGELLALAIQIPHD